MKERGKPLFLISPEGRRRSDPQKKEREGGKLTSFF